VKQSRLQQLVDWCGASSDFDGCLIFDECHRAKHFVPVSCVVSPSLCVCCHLVDVVTASLLHSLRLPFSELSLVGLALDLVD